MRRLLVHALLLFVIPTAAGAQSAPVVEYYHVDALGSVRAVTNAAGAEVRRHDYAPFGEGLAAVVGADQMRFVGKERDLESGLDYFKARHLNARWGRFTTVDPLMDTGRAVLDPQQWNRYAYVTNNPLKFIDPTGMQRAELMPVEDRMFLNGEITVEEYKQMKYEIARGNAAILGGDCCARNDFHADR